RQAPLRGLLGRQCGRGGRCLHRHQPRGRFHSHRLVPHSGARSAFRAPGGAQRPRCAVLPESQRAEPFTDDQLAAWTKKAMTLSAYRDDKLDLPSTFPPQIQHVLYIEKENRTYDQVLGDMKEGNGDPSLVLFGEDVTPNLHQIAREFVLLDNFYVNSD